MQLRADDIGSDSRTTRGVSLTEKSLTLFDD